MTPTYEAKFFKNMARVLLDREPEILRRCQEAGGGGVGAAYAVYSTVEAFAEGSNYSLSYHSLSGLRESVRDPRIDWNGYINLRPSRDFVLAMTAPSLNGTVLHKTIGLEDDGGPPDVTEVELYAKLAFIGQCLRCRKSTVRRRLVVNCVHCGTELRYCGSNCMEADRDDHAAINH